MVIMMVIIPPLARYATPLQVLDDPASCKVLCCRLRVGRLEDAGCTSAAATLAPFQSHAAVFLGITDATYLS
jgi:hypothetical protein